MGVIKLKASCLPTGLKAWHKHKEWNKELLLGSQQSSLLKDMVQKIKALQKKKLSSFLPEMFLFK